MADVVEFRTYTDTPSGSFVSTAFLDDNAPGDETTNASGNDPTSIGDIQDGFGAAETIFVEGRWTLDSLRTLNDVEFTCLFTRDSPVQTTNAWTLYWGDASEVYTSLASGGASWDVPVTITWSGSQAGVKFVKVLLALTRTAIGAPQISLSLTDFRLSADVTNEVPQCATRTFAEQSSITKKTSYLWEIWNPGGNVIDFGDRFDRWGVNGWGVLSPGLTGSGSITISAPGGAPIAEGYTALVSTASVLFDVIAGTCPGTDPVDYGAVSKMIIHSTGVLYAAPRLTAGASAFATLTRVNLGSPPAPSNALANAFDSSPTTLVDTTYTNAGNRSYLRADFGASANIGSVLLRNITSTGNITVYVSGSAITDGDFSGATALTTTGTQPVTNGPLLFLPTGGATIVAGRYVYIVGATAAFTVGDIDIRGERIRIAYVQNAGVQFVYQEALLRDACWVTEHPVADAQFDCLVTLNAESAIFSLKAVKAFLGGTLTTPGGSIDRLTAGLTDVPLRFNAELTTQDVNGKNVVFTVYEMVAPNLDWNAPRTDYFSTKLEASMRLSDQTGVPWRIEVDV